MARKKGLKEAGMEGDAKYLTISLMPASPIGQTQPEAGGQGSPGLLSVDVSLQGLKKQL